MDNGTSISFYRLIKIKIEMYDIYAIILYQKYSLFKLRVQERKKMNRIGGSMGNRHAESLAEKNERLAELDDCATLCFYTKKTSNMEAKQPAKQSGPQRQTMRKKDMETQSREMEHCCDFIQCVVFTIAGVFDIDLDN
jgi:hypothetical protein